MSIAKSQNHKQNSTNPENAFLKWNFWIFVLESDSAMSCVGSSRNTVPRDENEN